MAEFNEGQKPLVNGQSLSQETQIVGNPLIGIETSDRELSQQEKTVLWANEAFEEYNNLSRQTGHERKRVKNLVHEAARQLIQNPERIDNAVSVWRSHENALRSQVPESDQPKDSFYEAVKQESVKLIKDRWEETTPNQLAQMVKSYANNVSAKDFAQEVLTSYFKAPSSKKQRVDARYTFTFAILDLIEDQKSFNEAIRIGLFGTVIIPKDSLYAKEGCCIGSIPWDMDDRTIQKYSVSTNIIGRLSFMASEDFGVLRSEIQKLFQSETYKDFVEKEAEKAARKIGKAEVKRINQAMSESKPISGDEIGEGISGEEFDELAKNWPTNLTLDENEPLNKKFRDLVGSKSDYEFIKRRETQLSRERGIKDSIFLSVPSAEGYILEIGIPSGLIRSRNEIVKLALNFKFSKEETERLDRHRHLFLSNFNIEILKIVDQVLTPAERFGDQTIVLTRRKASGSERNYHPLQALGTIGFPTSGNDGQDLAEEIQKKQIRFLNRRGIRVPLEGQLKDLGYSHIDFHKDTDPDKILIKIFVGDVAYSVKLDKYFNLDLEGKRFDNLALSQSLRYAFLSLLRPILCEERIKDPHLPEVGAEEKEIVSRMGHLRWLPRGRRFTEKAVGNCFEHEGKDLFAVNFQRMQEHENDEKHKGMETTYVKPVIEKEENLPPITIHLPGVLQFS